MVITDLMDVAAALDAGLVPAEMVNPEFMDLLASSEKVVFGEDADGLVHRLITASLTGTQTSLGKDIPEVLKDVVFGYHLHAGTFLCVGFSLPPCGVCLLCGCRS